MTAEEVLALAHDEAVEFVDLRFTTLLGRCSHVTLPIADLKPQRIKEGFVLAGLPHQNPCRLVPVPETAFVDPFFQHPTLVLLCDVQDPATGQEAPDDPRAVARRAEAHLHATGSADRALFSLTLEFFVFDQVSYEQGMNAAHYLVDSREGVWRRGREEVDNLGTQLRAGEGAGPLPPADSLHNLRAEMVAALTACGIQCGEHRHGGATGGQTRLEIGPAPLVRAADLLITCKYVIRNVAARHGKVATFMPQPLLGDRGSGLPTRLALSKAEQPLLYSTDDTTLAESGRWVIGGWLHHAPGLLALTCPTTNSYRRFVSGSDAPTCTAYSLGNPAALVHTPVSTGSPLGGEVEFRATDPSCNPYLALSALLLAALDGIENRRDPGPPLDDCPDASSDAAWPRTLAAALDALAGDHAYLLKGNVFAGGLIERWIDHKRAIEIEALRIRPHPYEFCLYFDA